MTNLINDSDITLSFIQEGFPKLPCSTIEEYFSSRDLAVAKLAEIDQAAVQTQVDKEIVAAAYSDANYNNACLADCHPHTIGKGGLCYKIELGDRVVLQDCVPEVQGWQLLTEENIAEVMETHRQKLIKGKAKQEVFMALRAKVAGDG